MKSPMHRPRLSYRILWGIGLLVGLLFAGQAMAQDDTTTDESSPPDPLSSAPEQSQDAAESATGQADSATDEDTDDRASTPTAQSMHPPPASVTPNAGYAISQAEETEWAADADIAPVRKRFGFGLRAGLGLCNAFGSLWDQVDSRPDLAGQLSMDLQGFVHEHWAITLGLSIGNRGNAGDVDGVAVKDVITYLDLPVGIRLELSRFAMGTSMGPAFALSGKSMLVDGDAERDWTEEDWELIRRANLAWKGFMGYVGRGEDAAFTFDVELAIHVLNDLEDSYSSDGYQSVSDLGIESRYMSLLFNFGVVFIGRR